MRPLRQIFLFATIIVLAGFVFLSCTSGGSNKNPMGPGGPTADVTITILGNHGSSSYSGDPDTVTVGQTVAWHNADTMTHTATALGGQFNTGSVAPGSTSAAITMSTAGSFAYHCTVPTHNMTGTLVVKP